MRRTCAIDSAWPEGEHGPLHLTGQARDLLTPHRGEARVVATAALDVLISPERKILRVAGFPAHRHLQNLTGAQIGGRYRALLGELFLDEMATSSLLYRLLDDLPGANFVATFAWSHWAEDRYAHQRAGQCRVDHRA